MLLVTSLAAFVVLAKAVPDPRCPTTVHKSLVSLRLAKNLNSSYGVSDLVERDRARASIFLEQSSTSAPDSISSVGVTNAAQIYLASVGVGAPPTYYNLIVDTGSSNTWVGNKAPYVPTNTSVKTSNSVSVTYGSGKFNGTEYTDTVTITPDLTISQQGIGIASNTSGLPPDIDGILGLGPANLTIRSLSPAKNESVPTVTDSLFESGAIPSNLVSVYFEPTTANYVKNGELTFGETDPSKFTGSITYAPITATYPASKYWGVNQSILYDASDYILNNSAGIVDTGTTLILLASDALDRYINATGAVHDNTTHLYQISLAQYANLKSLFFTIGDSTLELTANAQIWPRALNEMIGGKTDIIYLIVNSLGSPSGKGFDFVIGYTFLERYYTVYDTTNSRVGFANTSFTMVDIN